MEEYRNKELKEDYEFKNKFQNSEFSSLSNKVKNQAQLNNSHNETFNEMNLTITNETDFKSNDQLYGNNYLNYFLDNHPSSNHCFNSKIKKMGNLNVFLFYKDQPLIVIGDKDKSLIYTYEIILQISFIVLFTTIINLIPFYMKYILILIYINCFLCHMFVYLINPGIPSIEFFSKKFLKSDNYLKMDDKEKKEYYLCEICNIMINNSDDIEHCEKCDICVKGYDHHCFWTGKCITKKNIWFFFCFSFGTMAYILWYFTIIIYWIITQTGQVTKIK